MPGKLYNPIHTHIILLLLMHACAGVASLSTRSTAAKCNDVENAIQTCITSQYAHGFDRLQVLASPWSPSTSIRSAMQTLGESYSQSPLKYRRGDIANLDLTPTYHTQSSEPGLVPEASPPGQAPVHSVSTSEVANSEQLNIPQTTPPPAAAVTLATSNNNAASPTNSPGNRASLPAAEPAQRTASESAVNSNELAPVRFSQTSAVLRQPTTHPPKSSNDIPDPTTLVSASGKNQRAPNSRGATSPPLPAAREDGTSVGMPRTPKTSLSRTFERAFAVPGTDQTSTMIPTTVPAILTVLGSAHNAYPASQRIEGGRRINSSDTARGSAGISSVGFMGNGTSGQKSSTAAETRANVTALSRPPVTVSSTSLFSVGTTATSPTTISSSSNAVGLQFKGAGSQMRGLEMIRLLGCLTLCMMVGARILA